MSTWAPAGDLPIAGLSFEEQDELVEMLTLESEPDGLTPESAVGLLNLHLIQRGLRLCGRAEEGTE